MHFRKSPIKARRLMSSEPTRENGAHLVTNKRVWAKRFSNEHLAVYFRFSSTCPLCERVVMVLCASTVQGHAECGHDFLFKLFSKSNRLRILLSLGYFTAIIYLFSSPKIVFPKLAL